MKVWNCGNLVEMNIGDKVLVARCCSGHSYFGEFATLTRVLKNSLVFTTDTGAIVKTSIDNLHQVIGKAKKEGYWVSVEVANRKNDKDFIETPVKFWNDKKLCFETK